MVKLNAFAAPIVGTAPTDDQQKAMRNAGEMSYAVWLWQALSPTRWHIAVPLLSNNPAICYFKMVWGYPNPDIKYPAQNNMGCGPAWIGDKCYNTQCNAPSKEAFDFLFKEVPHGASQVPRPGEWTPQDQSRRRVPSRNGWNLPCVGSCPLQ